MSTTEVLPKISAPLAPVPPFSTVVIYNQSKHACQSVLADIRAVWGGRVRVYQTLEEGLTRLPGVDATIPLAPSNWGNMQHFEERLNAVLAKDHKLYHQIKSRDVVFMPGWSAFAESPEAARAVEKLGLVWPGTEPVASELLEKIGFKRTCAEVGAPTPAFEVLAEESFKADLLDPEVREKTIRMFMDKIAGMNSSEKGLIKSIHGGGGKGTAHLDDPSDPIQARASVEKVLNEMHRADGIYFEQKVNTKGDGRFFQIELEVDGDVCANGGRFVWFNSRLQKVVEIGLSDNEVSRFMPQDLYQKARGWSSEVARRAGNNTRATMEALVFYNEKGECEIQFIECNRRPQVENEALALLEQDSAGNRRYTFCELMMRAKGYPAPQLKPSTETNVVLHARILHGDPDNQGDITYQAGDVLGMAGPRLDYIKAELLAPGRISFTSDPQLGKCVIVADSWEQMCDRAVEYFTLRKPVVMESASTYGQTMINLFGSDEFRAAKVASNETFKLLEIPEHPRRTMMNVLEDQVAKVMVNGYRNGEGVDPLRWPTETAVAALETVQKDLQSAVPRATEYTKFARGEISYESYMSSLREQLAQQGGGWVSVAPRDTAQQGFDSESGGVTNLSRKNAEIWAEQAGCVGYEIGGAQYQAGLIRGFDPAKILTLGLPYNMAAHSLQRSQYANGLTWLTPEIRKELFKATADVVQQHYRAGAPQSFLQQRVPWNPYNFHAGNFFNPKTNYSPQDDSTRELLKESCVPMPNWVFSPKFSLEDLKKWTARQVDLFASEGMQLQQVRIKNPGQGIDWTPGTIWEHCSTMIKVFRDRKMPDPVIYLHNHDFNGLGGHIAKELYLMAQKEGFNTLVIDAGYRKCATHNDNTVSLSALKLSPEQQDALLEYNHNQMTIEQILSRFDSRYSQMTPWDSDWAGGTEGSDIRIAKEYNIDPRKINMAKEIASEVFPLERAVTPFSEYKLRLGIGIMIEDGIQPKSVENVRKWIQAGGKLKVGGDVLVGLQQWETLVPKSPEVDMLLKNMPQELEAALNQKSSLITPESLPADFSAAQRHTALGYQAKGLEFAKVQAKGQDNTPLLLAPHILHRKPLTTPAGTAFDVLDPNGQPQQVIFEGFGKTAKGDISLQFVTEGQTVRVSVEDPNAVQGAVAKLGPRKAAVGNANEIPCQVPGELLSYSVKVGDVLKAGEPLCVFESMKMEMKISVPDDVDGKVVARLPINQRTKTTQGDILAPGDLLLEVEDAK